MLTYPEIDPIIISFGILKVRWYGLMYLMGFTSTYFLVLKQLKQFNWNEFAELFDNLNLYLILGVIFGGRLGYVLFYQPSYYFHHPLEILATWEGEWHFTEDALG